LVTVYFYNEIERKKGCFITVISIHKWYSFLIVLNVITKGRGNRPVEALATLYKKEGAKFYFFLNVFQELDR